MKLNKKALHQQRRQLDEKLRAWRKVSKLASPRSGWLKAVRESLGMTSRHLATLLGTNNSAVVRMEKREAEGKITLTSLSRAAEAMGCRVVYAVVPAKTLEKVVDDKARQAAAAVLRGVSHSMKLENQAVTGREARYQLKELTRQMKERLDKAMWEPRA